MIDLGLLEQQAVRPARQRRKLDIIGDLAADADLRKKRFDNERAAHEADLADSYREALRTRNPQDEMGIQDLAEQGFGPEVIPYRTELANRGEKQREYDSTLEEKKALDEANRIAKENAQNKADAGLVETTRHNKVSEALERWKALHPQAAANASQRDIVSLRSQADKSAKPYTSGKDAYAQAIEEYNNLAKNPNGLDAKANQQGIIDKYITSSTGKSTTQEQFKQLVEQSPGIENYLNNIGSKITVGKLLPNAMINALMRNMRDYQLGLNQNLKQRNEDLSSEANIRGIDPAGIMLTPSDRLTSDSSDYVTHLYGNEAKGKQAPTKNIFNKIFGTTPDEPLTPIHRAGSNRSSAKNLPESNASPVDVNHALADSIFGTSDDAKADAIFKKHKKAK